MLIAVAVGYFLLGLAFGVADLRRGRTDDEIQLGLTVLFWPVAVLLLVPWTLGALVLILDRALPAHNR